MRSTSMKVVGLTVIATVSALLVPVSSVSAASGTAARPAAAKSGPVRQLPVRPVTRLIVRTSNGQVASSAVRSAAATALGVNRAPVLRRLASGSTLVGLSSPVSLTDAWKASRALTARADVAYAEPDVWMFPSDVSPITPNDPRFPAQWDLWDTSPAAGGYSSRAPRAWDRTTGKPEVVVAVLDTGLTVHPDISSSVTSPVSGDPIVAGYDFVSLDDVSTTSTPDLRPLTANDGDGRDPDPSDPGDWISASEDAGTDGTGWFVNCGGQNPDGSSDSSWHGTHVTGTIVAKQDNGVGISGIAPGVSVQPVRVLGKCGGYMSDIADGVAWASGGHVSGVPDSGTKATVINMSLGGAGVCATTLSDAIAGARSRGTTVVVAAGNGDANGNGVSITPTPGSESTTGAQPADCPGVVVVAATDRTGHSARYSNFGTASNPITIAAPGGAGTGGVNDVLSTLNSGRTTPEVTPAGYYQYYAGTSMATPHVAAAVALMQSQLPTQLTPDAVSARIAATARPTASLPGCTVAKCGAGLLDIGAALAAAPEPPTTVDASAASNAVDLSWSAAAPNGSAIVGYHVQGQAGAGGAWQDVTPSTASTATVLRVTAFADTTPVVNGTTYTFRVAAINGVGESGYTTSAAVTPDAVPAPDQPAAPTVTGGLEQLDPITWTAPGPGGGGTISSYSLRYRLVGTSTWSCVSGTAPECLTGSAATTASLHTWPVPLPGGTYEVQVAAVNASGRGQFSPSGTAVVTALAQHAATSAPVLRPYRDGFQDGVKITATSNASSNGSLRILNSAGTAVLIVPLAAGTSWSYTWTGLNARKARVPNGVYRAQVLLTGRGATPATVALLRITVASSQAGRPAIAVSSSTVYPYVDKYIDSISITTTAGIPAAYTWKLLRGRATVWTASFRTRMSATTSFAGKGSNRAALPSGAYTLLVVAKGGEGVAVSRSRTIWISSQRLRSQKFTVDRAAASSAPVARNGTLETPGTGAVYVQGGQLVTFAPALPSSVKGYAAVTVETCTEFGGEPGAEVYLQYMSDDATFVGPTQGPLGNAGGYCYYSSSIAAQAPAASIWLGRVHFGLGNITSTPAAYYVSAFRITGYRYYLA